MRLSQALYCAAALLAGSALAAPVADPLIVTPGGASDVVLSSDNTINATAAAQAAAIQGETETKPRFKMLTASTTTTSNGYLQLSFVNKLASTAVNAYVTGMDSNGALVMLYPNGTWYYPPDTSSGVPVPITANVSIPLGGQGSTTNITLPGFITAGRIWFADGELTFFTVAGGNGVSLVEPSAVNPSDPSAAVNWGFVELTYANNEIYTNISYVDFLGLPLGQTLTDRSGDVQTALGVTSDAVDDVCADLDAQTCVDGYPWGDLCATESNGYALRVLSPTDYLSLYPDAFSDYFTDYVNEVWAHYALTPLTIDTQVGAGQVNCTVSGSTMTCAGDNRGYAKPSASDIFGCNSGPFAIAGSDNDVHRAVVPRLCAAFHRSTLLLKGGNLQPVTDTSLYYTGTKPNWYSKFVHDYEKDSKGYAFSYDDVTPTNGPDSSGLLALQNPKLLTITVGGV